MYQVGVGGAVNAARNANQTHSKHSNQSSLVGRPTRRSPGIKLKNNLVMKQNISRQSGNRSPFQSFHANSTVQEKFLREEISAMNDSFFEKEDASPGNRSNNLKQTIKFDEQFQIKLQQHPFEIENGISIINNNIQKPLTLQTLKEDQRSVILLKKSVRYKLYNKEVFYDRRSLYLFRGDMKFRKGIVWLIESKVFEYFILLMILLNSLTLAIYDYSDRDSTTLYNQVLDDFGFLFTAVFTAECILKIIGQGFIIHRGAYLRDGWNLIDFTVVISGLIEALPIGTVRLRSLRVLRVLRPLRSINAIPSMKKNVTALIQALPDFGNVGIFLLFVFLLFAILGLHQYNGIMYNACRYNSKPENSSQWLIDTSISRVCSQSGLGVFSCPATEYCGNPGDQEISLDSDAVINNSQINFGITTFDNLGSSLLTVFQIITTDAWSPIMFNLMDADMPYVSAIYCIVLVIIGAFFLMNLILAVIIQAFIKIQKNEIDAEVMKLPDLRIDEDEIGSIQPVDQAQQPQNNEHTKSPRELDKTHISNQIDENDNFQDSLNIEQNLDLMNIVENKSARDDKSIQSRNQNKLHSNGSQQTVKGQSHRESSLQSKIIQSHTNLDVQTLHQIKEKTEKPENSIDQKLQQEKRDSNTSKNLVRGTLKAQLEQHQQADLSFLKQMGMKRKVINLFNQVKEENKNFSIEAVNALDEWKQIESLQYDTNRENNEKERKNADINVNPDLSRSRNNEALKRDPTSQNTQDLQDILDKKDEQKGKEDNLANEAFQAYLSKMQAKKQTREQYYNQLLKEAKDNIRGDKRNLREQTSLRQLASLKLGLQLRRQTQNLGKQYKRFQIEFRADKNKIYQFFFKLQNSQYFVGFISLVIIANTAVLAMDSYPEEEDTNTLLNRVNIALSLVFIGEMVIKIIGLGFKGYILYDSFNKFDCFIVLTSIVDLFVSNLLIDSGGALTALRGFRLLRIFKLAKSWKNFHNLLKTIGRTLKDVSTFSILLFLFMFVYSLLGLELFAFKAKFDKEGNVDMINGTDPDTNFNKFYTAFTTVFIILTNDGWTAIYYNMYRAVGSASSTIFFITLIIIGQKVLLNLFLAILLENFDESALKEQHKQDFKKYKNEDQQLSRLQKVIASIKGYFMKAFKSNKVELGAVTPIRPFGSSTIRGLTPSNQQTTINSTIRSRDSNKSVSSIDNDLYIEGKSLYLFNHESKLRDFLFNIITSKYFDYFIMCVITVSSVQLALENPLNDPNGQLETILYWIDFVSALIFISEAVMKIITFGFLFAGKPSYLRNPWNLMDFIIILFTILALSPLSDTFMTFKMFRILRTLRLVSRNEGLKVGIKALINAIPSIANVTIIMLLFFLIFGIIAISYFKGTFYYCDQTQSALTNINIITKWDCINAGAEWMNKDYTFDNIGRAMVTLFIMSTTSGWSDVMYLSISATEINSVQQKWNNPYWICFFIIFIIVGAFFLLNLFVGVVISTFNSEQDKIGGNDLLTEKQKEWIDTRLVVLKSTPIKKSRPPSNIIRRVFYKIQENKWFDNFILLAIILNTIVLCLKWYDQPDTMQTVAENLNYFFTALFASEAIIKIIALDKAYFKEGWNIFDFVVVLGSFASIFLTLTTSLNLGGATTIIRAFRISRIFRLIKRARHLRIVFNTFIVTLPALANIGGLLLLLLYLYSILGVLLFGEVKRNGIFNDNLNFESFGNAFITLFTVSTGDSWEMIMSSSLHQRDITFNCVESPTYEDYINNGKQTVGCGPGPVGYLFYFSYILLVNLIFLNLFIAIILQGFTDTQQKDNRLFNSEMLQKFRQVWADFDPDATTFIQISQLKDFMFALGEPLGFDQSFKGNKFLQDKYIAQLELPIYNNFTSYQFIDVLEALSLKTMIKDHTKKSIKLKKEQANSISSDSEEEGRKNTIEREEEIKEEIEHDINKLKFQKEVQNIQALREVDKKEKKMEKNTQHRDSYMTSLHQAAAEVAFNHMRYVVAKKRLMKKIEQMEGEDDIDHNSLQQKAEEILQKEQTIKYEVNINQIDEMEEDKREESHESEDLTHTKKRKSAMVNAVSLMRQKKIYTPNTSQKGMLFEPNRSTSGNNKNLDSSSNRGYKEESSFLGSEQIDKIIDQEMALKLEKIASNREDFKQSDLVTLKSKLPLITPQKEKSKFQMMADIDNLIDENSIISNQFKTHSPAINVQPSVIGGSMGGTGEQVNQNSEEADQSNYMLNTSDNYLILPNINKSPMQLILEQKELSEIIQSELEKMITKKKTQLYIEQLEIPGVSNKDQESIKEDLLNDSLIQELQQAIENKLATDGNNINNDGNDVSKDIDDEFKDQDLDNDTISIENQQY